MFILLVRDGGREPAVRIEAAGGMQIGRAPENQLVLTDPNVGRKAARIVEDRGKYYLEDLGSTNPTSVRGGRKLSRGEREPLRHGLVIDVGRSSIEFQEQGVRVDDRTNADDATNADDTGTNFGEATIVGPPPSSLESTPQEQRASDFDRTMKPPPARPATRPPVEPAPRQAPAPVPERSVPPPKSPPVPSAPQPISSSTVDFMGPGGVGSGTQSIRPVSGDLGSIGAMLTRRARLVIVNEALRRIDMITREATLIGRETGEIRIDHRAISQPHAMIRWTNATSSFQIEDRKSRNQTMLGGVTLNPEVPQQLTPECLLRFGPIEAVFVVDIDSENAKIPEEHYLGALRHLQGTNEITAEQARVATEEAKKGEKHVGEALMMAGVISAKSWARAFEMGKSGLAPVDPVVTRKKLLIGIGALVVLALIAWLVYSKLG